MAESTDVAATEKGGANSVTKVTGQGPLSSVRKLASDPGVRRSVPAILGVVLTVIGLGAFYFLNKPPLTTLYANMPDAEKARVVESLKNSGVQVSLDPTTGDVLVPTSDYHSARMQLAAQGLPTSVPEGYDTIGEIPMGSSRTVENVRLKQSQEIELARSISEIQGLVAARVHLAIPEKVGLCPCFGSAICVSFCPDGRWSLSITTADQRNCASCLVICSKYAERRGDGR